MLHFNDILINTRGCTLVRPIIALNVGCCSSIEWRHLTGFCGTISLQSANPERGQANAHVMLCCLAWGTDEGNSAGIDTRVTTACSRGNRQSDLCVDSARANVSIEICNDERDGLPVSSSNVARSTHFFQESALQAGARTSNSLRSRCFFSILSRWILVAVLRVSPFSGCWMRSQCLRVVLRAPGGCQPRRIQLWPRVAQSQSLSTVRALLRGVS